ncbi:MAG: hypothetical protein AB1641_17315 [Thermodesulfobacteriota bacterium]
MWGFFKWIEEHMTAIAFAEAGEFETAKWIMAQRETTRAKKQVRVTDRKSPRQAVIRAPGPENKF